MRELRGERCAAPCVAARAHVRRRRRRRRRRRDGGRVTCGGRRRAAPRWPALDCAGRASAHWGGGGREGPGRRPPATGLLRSPLPAPDCASTQVRGKGVSRGPLGGDSPLWPACRQGRWHAAKAPPVGQAFHRLAQRGGGPGPARSGGSATDRGRRARADRRRCARGPIYSTLTTLVTCSRTRPAPSSRTPRAGRAVGGARAAAPPANPPAFPLAGCPEAPPPAPVNRTVFSAPVAPLPARRESPRAPDPVRR
jgi:hypothetical protein